MEVRKEGKFLNLFLTTESLPSFCALWKIMEVSTDVDSDLFICIFGENTQMPFPPCPSHNQQNELFFKSQKMKLMS